MLQLECRGASGRLRNLSRQPAASSGQHEEHLALPDALVAGVHRRNAESAVAASDVADERVETVGGLRLEDGAVRREPLALECRDVGGAVQDDGLPVVGRQALRLGRQAWRS